MLGCEKHMSHMGIMQDAGANGNDDGSIVSILTMRPRCSLSNSIIDGEIGRAEGFVMLLVLRKRIINECDGCYRKWLLSVWYGNSLCFSFSLSRSPFHFFFLSSSIV